MLTHFRKVVLIAALFALCTAAPASADLTAFVGLSPSPERHPGFGGAIGSGLLVIGFEIEYCDLKEDKTEGVPGLKTGMGNLLVQTPIPIHGWQFYGTAGGGLYRERSGDDTETSFVGNIGGGAKFTLSGPVRLRFDYRILTLRGDPLHDRIHRFYAGLNLAF
jgi:opacity protein-like surface antigen